MRIVVAGGTGFLGRPLVRSLRQDGHDAVVLTRRPAAGPGTNGIRFVTWRADGSAGPWAREVDGAGIVLNLTGAGIADARWTDRRKAELLSSRVLPTRSLLAAIAAASVRPPVFIQGSAVGYYGTAPGDRTLDESSPPGRDYLARLCVQWEAESHPAAELGCRLIVLRSGVVLAWDGGMLARLRLPFLLFAGGPVASGRQVVSWIHRDDWVAMLRWVLDLSVTGPFNACAPEPVLNAELTAAYARALHRPNLLRMPAFALRALYGEMAQAMLIEGQRVVPRRALDMGFTFRHPAIGEALAHPDSSGR